MTATLPDLDIQLQPEHPDAAAPMAVLLTMPQDGGGERSLIATLIDAEGATLATAPLGHDIDNRRLVAKLPAIAPETPGAHHWHVLLQAADAAEDAPPLAAVEVAFESCAHSIRPTVWGVPPAVERGRPFRVAVGLRCSAGCPSAGWEFRVLDAAGTEIATGRTGAAPAPGTDALHFTELELPAPEAEGKHVWTVLPVRPAAGPDGAPPHAVKPAELRLTVVPRAEHVIRIRAVDAASGAPLERAKVVAHPFRAFTGPGGCAELPVPRGTYRVFVSGRPYFPFRQDTDVDGDIDIVAQMYPDRDYDEADQWA
jgi:hypothetical protein